MESEIHKGNSPQKARREIVEISASYIFTFFEEKNFFRETSVKHSKIHEKTSQNEKVRVNIHFFNKWKRNSPLTGARKLPPAPRRVPV